MKITRDRKDHYILKGKKAVAVPAMEWAEWLGNNRDKKTIRQTRLTNGKFVSTVFLGLNHQFGEGMPLIFETMVFSKNGDWSDKDMARYSTYEEAEEGHELMVKKWEDQ